MKKIAIVGSGISGLYAAYLLHNSYDLTIYEKNNYLGGHTRTLNINYNENVNINVDTGFIVFNKGNYPNFYKMLCDLKIDIEKSDMSFAITSTALEDPEIKFKDFNSYFANKARLLNPKYYNLLYNINRFNNLSKKTLNSLNIDNKKSLADFLNDNNFSKFFIESYIVPMGSSIWSCNPSQILEFPYLSYIRFMKNHGLLSLINQPQWYVIKGGSKTYVEALKKLLKAKIRLNEEVLNVEKLENRLKITSKEGVSSYDYVIYSNHPNQVLKIGNNLDNEQRKAMDSIKYSKNAVILHSDCSVMPKNKKYWASWIYKKTNKSLPILTYWMNSLQNIDKNYPVFVSLNPGDKINKSKIYDIHELDHPIFNSEALVAQERIPDLQGRNLTFFCGAYHKYGFHEDGVLSSIEAVSKLKEIDN